MQIICMRILCFILCSTLALTATNRCYRKKQDNAFTKYKLNNWRERAIPIETPSAFQQLCDLLSPKDERIMGGTTSLSEAFPHMVSLQYKVGDTMYHFCGGSLIDKKWVVTAAHCCYDENQNKLSPESFTIVAGNANLQKCPTRSGRRQNGCVRMRVRRIIPHPNYDSANILNDIALFELNDEVEFTRSIRPILIPESIPPLGTEHYLTGWGSDPFNSANRLQLKETEFPLLPDSACNNLGLGMKSSRGQVCAGKESSDACSGDSGGPLFKDIDDDADNSFYLHSITGLVSYGLACSQDADRNRGVYTNVPFFKSWINSYAHVQHYNETDLEELMSKNYTNTSTSPHGFMVVIVSVLVMIVVLC